MRNCRPWPVTYVLKACVSRDVSGVNTGQRYSMNICTGHGKAFKKCDFKACVLLLGA